MADTACQDVFSVLHYERNFVVKVRRTQCPVCAAVMDLYDDQIERCPSCGYFQSNFIAGGGTGIGGLEALRRTNFERVLDRLACHRTLSGARLLEVGCAKGWFLDAARRRGMVVQGIEPELENQQIASRQGLDVLHGFFPEAVRGAGPYDVIAFNDVFEHLPDPATAIQAVEKLLPPRGIVLLNIPSSNGALFRLARILNRIGFRAPWQRLWQMGLSSPHISYFNSGNLVALAARHARLRQIDEVRLKSMTRDGLRDRVKSANPGIVGEIMLASVWALSFVVDVLPSDIVLVVLEKP